MDWLLIGIVCLVLSAVFVMWMYRARRRDADDQRLAARVNADAEQHRHTGHSGDVTGGGGFSA